jgi:glutamate formiminotransferase/glutamate formiminotransferase/formiminotetrahydrofolate cyclodeaminase
MSAASRHLLAVPNVSEGRDRASVEAIAGAFALAGAARLLDVHADVDHHRAVVSLAGRPGSLAQALVHGAQEAVRHIDLGDGRRGAHPHVGAVDVVPVVYLDESARGAACAEALVAAHEIAEQVGVPVLMYGELAAGRTRAELRRGGAGGLAERLRRGELHADFGPRTARAAAGVTLVAARPPLVAFNLELAPPAGVREAAAIAAAIREGGAEGLRGLRAIGVALRRPGADPDPSASGAAAGRDAGERLVGQVSMNVERPTELPLAEVVAAVARHARIARAELVGLAPRAALAGFPADLPIPGFDPARHVIENALGL